MTWVNRRYQHSWESSRLTSLHPVGSGKSRLLTEGSLRVLEFMQPITFSLLNEIKDFYRVPLRFPIENLFAGLLVVNPIRSLNQSIMFRCKLGFKCDQKLSLFLILSFHFPYQPDCRLWADEGNEKTISSGFGICFYNWAEPFEMNLIIKAIRADDQRFGIRHLRSRLMTAVECFFGVRATHPTKWFFDSQNQKH